MRADRYLLRIRTVLVGILFLGYVLTRLNPSWTRRTGIVVQGIVLLGTVIGRFGIIAGFGPRTILDLIFYRDHRRLAVGLDRGNHCVDLQCSELRAQRGRRA